MLHGLATVWSEAVGGTAIQFHQAPATLVTGALAAAVACWVTMWLALRRHLKVPARQLLAEGASEWAEASAAGHRAVARIAAVGHRLGLLVGLGVPAGLGGVFFGAGAMLLMGLARRQRCVAGGRSGGGG
jgi:hypothetical protein